MNNILISACLLGHSVRYDGNHSLIEHPLIKQWQQQNRLIPLCPEVEGGLPIPRAPAEIINPSLILNTDNKDVTQAFILGAQKALQTARDNHCTVAILTERSPSCGSNEIYDGRFNRTTKRGMGITTALLEQHGITVFNQYNLEAAEEYLQLS